MRTVIIGVEGLLPELLFGNEEAVAAPALLEDSSYGVLEDLVPLDREAAWAVFRSGNDAGSLGLWGARDRVARGAGIELGRGVADDLLGATLGDRGALRFAQDLEVEEGETAQAFLDRLRHGFEDCAARIAEFIEAGSGELVEFLDRGMMTLEELAPGFADDEEDAGLVLAAYRALDAFIGRVVGLLGDDDLFVLVAPFSVQNAESSFALNDWLAARGYLVFGQDTDAAQSIEDADIDWTRTRAFALGGAEGRIYLNIAGRDASGIVPREEAATLRAAITEELAVVTDGDGGPLRAEVIMPEDYFLGLEGVAPDLIVVLESHTVSVDDRLRSGPQASEGPRITIGQGGSFLIRSSSSLLIGEIPSARLEDLLPTLAELAGREVPTGLTGRSLLDGLTGEGGRDRADDEEAAQRRLRGLGYL